MQEASTISVAVEGLLDEAVIGRLIRHVGGQLGTVYGKKGKKFLESKIGAYNLAARHGPWIVLIDLDHEQDCAPPVRARWLPYPTGQMCFRIAVRTIEAWLMADAERLASFIGIHKNRVPANPEALDNPKQVMVNLARRSRLSDIRLDLEPRPQSGRVEGPAYTSRLVEFVVNHWRPDIAAERADSLRRTMCRLRQLTADSA